MNLLAVAELAASIEHQREHERQDRSHRQAQPRSPWYRLPASGNTERVTAPADY
jgi:hypothetical protein